MKSSSITFYWNKFRNCQKFFLHPHFFEPTSKSCLEDFFGFKLATWHSTLTSLRLKSFSSLLILSVVLHDTEVTQLISHPDAAISLNFWLICDKAVDCLLKFFCDSSICSWFKILVLICYLFKTDTDPVKTCKDLASPQTSIQKRIASQLVKYFLYNIFVKCLCERELWLYTYVYVHTHVGKEKKYNNFRGKGNGSIKHTFTWVQ